MLDYSEYITTQAWAEDFWMAFLERPKFLRWLTRIIIGRYAWNELMGMKQHLDKHIPYINSIGYSLRNIDYHKELDKFKNW